VNASRGHGNARQRDKGFRVGFRVDLAALIVPDAFCADCHRPVVSAPRRVWCARCSAWVCWFTVDAFDEVPR